MRTVFEIGANGGDDIARYLYDQQNVIYAFEPAPHLYFDIIERFRSEKRLHLVNAAVDIQNGCKKFNIAQNTGCHSLYEFTDNIIQKWKGHDDLHFINSYKNIQCIRLDTFMNMHNIQKIDFLEIDTQGNDWNVLKSLGDRINDVVEGRCEASYKLNLYKTENSWSDLKHWLESKNFEVYVQKHAKHEVEVDLIFKRKG